MPAGLTLCSLYNCSHSGALQLQKNGDHSFKIKHAKNARIIFDTGHNYTGIDPIPAWRRVLHLQAPVEPENVLLTSWRKIKIDKIIILKRNILNEFDRRVCAKKLSLERIEMSNMK